MFVGMSGLTKLAQNMFVKKPFSLYFLGPLQLQGVMRSVASKFKFTAYESTKILAIKDTGLNSNIQMKLNWIWSALSYIKNWGLFGGRRDNF